MLRCPSDRSGGLAGEVELEEAGEDLLVGEVR
jgi:hypothetical protein